MAATNTKVLGELRAKLGNVSNQAISQRRRRLQDVVAMPTDIATYLVAQKEGVRIERHLDQAMLRTVAEFQSRLAAATSPAETPSRGPARRSRQSRTSTETTLSLGDTKIPTGALSEQHMQDAKRMADIYPVLYAFENSMRQFIDGHLRSAYGDKWHDDPKIVSSATRGRVERNRSAEARHRYHSTRSARFIFYTELGDLPNIASSENGWKVFKSLLPSSNWLHGRVEVIEASRNVVAHMNALKKRDIDRIKLNFHDWIEQIKGQHPAP